jgi:hypothetical protein
MRLWEFTSHGVLYHSTTADCASGILEEGFRSSNDGVDDDKNGHYFISCSTDPDLWFAGGYKHSGNVTFVLNKPHGYELEAVDRWDEVRIMLGPRDEMADILALDTSPKYPANKHTIREIWIKRTNPVDSGRYIKHVIAQAEKLNIPVVDKTEQGEEDF